MTRNLAFTWEFHGSNLVRTQDIAASEMIFSRDSTRFSGLDSSVGIASGYGWTVRGSNPGGQRDFLHPLRPAVGPTQPPIQWVQGLSPGWKSDRGRGIDHPPPSSAEVKKRVEVYLYSPSGPSWPVVR